MKYTLKNTILYLVGWCVIYAMLLFTNNHYTLSLSLPFLFFILVMYSIILELFINMPTYQYFKKHRPDIFSSAYVKRPWVNNFKFVRYVFSENDDDDDFEKILFKKYGSIIVILNACFFVSIIVFDRMNNAGTS